MKITTIRIPDELDRQITIYAEKKDLSKNQVVKEALRKLFRDETTKSA